MDVGDFVHPDIEISDDYTVKCFIDENGILNCINPVCPDCKSNNVVKGSLYSKKVFSEDFDGSIVMRMYKCKKCNRTFIPDLKDQYGHKAHFSNSLKEKAWEVKELNWSSLRDIVEYFKIFCGIDMSHETVRKWLIVIGGNEIDYELPKLSGYYGYDAQWVKINKKWKYRHAFYDLAYKMPVAELFAE